MKVYKKNELKLVDGLLVHETTGDVVAIDSEIVDLANELETRVQKAAFIKSQPEACAGPDISKFKRKSMNEINLFTCETPLHDKKVNDAIAFMDEIDSIQVTDSMNNALKGLFPLIVFTREDAVLSIDGQNKVSRFDTPTLGNPLEWSEDTVATVVAMYHGFVNDDAEDDLEDDVEDDNVIPYDEVEHEVETDEQSL